MNSEGGCALGCAPFRTPGFVAAFGWRAVYLGRVPIAAIALGLTPVLRGGSQPVPAPLLARPDTPLFHATDRRTSVIANAVNPLANAAQFFVWLLVPYYLVDRRWSTGGGWTRRRRVPSSAPGRW